MGLFDFLKKKQRPVEKTDKITLEGLPQFIKFRRDNIKTQENEVFKEIKAKLITLTPELKESIKILENIDINDKKVEPRAKFIVKENLNHYLNHLKKMIVELESIKTENLYEIIKEIDEKFLDFDKRSRLNYEKATFLIGNELGRVKDKINNFFTEIKAILAKNKYLVDENKTLTVIESKIKDMHEIEKVGSEILQRIKHNDEQIKRKRIEHDIKENNILEIKKSDEYQKELESIDKKESEYRDLEKVIYELKQLIDFKKLANIYHYDPKKMDLINQYKLSFKNSFEKNNGDEILRLLTDANMTDSFISKKITEIKEMTKEFNKKYRSIENIDSKRIIELQNNVKELSFNIDDLNMDNNKENKKMEKINENKGLIITEINRELVNMNAEIVK